jgi:hypothetical protein
MKNLLKKFYEYSDNLLWTKDIDSIDNRIELFVKEVPQTYLVVYCLFDGHNTDGEESKTDHYEAFEDEASAKERYEDILELYDLYSASITVVIESTDYLT